MLHHNIPVCSSAAVDFLHTHRVIDDFEQFSFGPLYDLSTEPFESYLGWNLGDEDIDLMRNLNGASPDTPPACWPHFATATHLTAHPEAQTVQDAATMQLIRDAQPADSPWVRHLSVFVDEITVLMYQNPATCLQTEQRRRQT
ncbi:hypothetical protein N7510_003420 [Penicillium lagena]|uniref:uncharacterized protein n=1 Tax=Penicillium lagena TaxID=94218 RepID=UPI0025404AA5|nr:uncharacterized protein N7510_003420 [Penicillium lagena]KAJ5619436.1 hypothetical protein N7510_003420 [Penicillium lagena]